MPATTMTTAPMTAQISVSFPRSASSARREVLPTAIMPPILRLNLDPDVTDQARERFVCRGLDGDDLDAAIVAAQIHAALDARTAAPNRSIPRSPATSNAPADLDAELAWLLKVNRYFVHQSHRAVEAADVNPTPARGTA